MAAGAFLAPAPIRSADAVRTRADLLARMEIVMGKFPGPEKKCPLDVQVTEDVDCGDYVRKFLTYQSEPGARVPAVRTRRVTFVDGVFEDSRSDPVTEEADPIDELIASAARIA